MIKRLAGAALGIAIAATATAHEVDIGGAGAGASVDGTIRIGDETVALTHVYAREVRAIPEMVSHGRPAQRLSLLILDSPLPAGGPTAAPLLSQLMASGRSRGIVVELDPRTGAVIGGNAVLAPRQDPQAFAPAPDAVQTEGFAISGGTVRGRIRSREPSEIGSADGGPAGFYSFDVSLSAPVEPAPRPLATLEDEAARASTPAQAFARFLGAIVAGDVAATKAGIARNHRCLRMVTAEVLPQVEAMLLAGRPDAAALLADLRKVYLYETRADLYFESPVGGTAVPMVREGPAWKVGE